jgi:cell division protein FtsZ
MNRYGASSYPKNRFLSYSQKTIFTPPTTTALQRSTTIMAIEMIEEFNQGTQIKVIGVGGGGGNAVDHMIAQGVQGVQFVCANTDAQALNRSSADHIIQLGNTGLGAGAKPEAGRAAAEEAVDRIRQSIDGAHMLFITAGMGGGTGTGAAPVIARVAKEMGILTVGVVTKPFEFEGNRRTTLADEGLAELEANVDSLIVILNDRLLDVLGDDISQDQAFAHANDVLKNAVGGISDIIHMPGLVNVDFEDVKTVMSEPGKAMMGTAIASGPDRATKAADAAVACPLLEGIDLSGARGVLVLIAANRSTFKLSESRNAMNTIRRYAADDAHVIYGTAYDESMGDQLRVTVIATGLSPQQARAQAQANMQVIHNVNMQRTGTDNMPFVPSHLNTANSRGGHDYSALSTPSVWRNGRTAAAKVDALASNGMDEIEIPAFLRKQAD